MTEAFMDLTPEIVFSLVRSDNDFPIDFDDAWRWIGYTRKENAKSKLVNNFDKNDEYIEAQDFASPNGEAKRGGHNRDLIYLTIECFKAFCMMAGTAKGRAVRKYFLDCEAELKRRIAKEKAVRQERVLNFVVDDQHHGWSKKFEDEFFDQAYRITGWQRATKGHPPCMGRFINENVYELFPEGTTDKLKQVNPLTEKGYRSRKHHQHLTKNIGLSLLDYQKGVTIAVMRLSPAGSPQSFKRNMSKACGEPMQLNLPYLDDLDVS
jgi:phage anti-repressor protein